jgi:DNA-binding NarL/FixJ family response regulator
MPLRNLLVLHPDPLVHRKVRSAFEHTPVRVHSARKMEDVDALLHNGLDIFLSATSLPDGNGYEIARLLRDRFPAALVVFITSAFEVYDPEKAGDSGGDGVLRMPMTPGDVRSTIESLIGPFSTQSVAAVEAVDRWAAASSDPDENLASFLPRSGQEDPLQAWSQGGALQGNVDPALQKAILQAVPQVLETAIRTALQSSPSFREMVAEAVRQAVLAEKTEAASKSEP